MTYKIHLISLGCAKNLVNSEQMLHLLKKAGHEIISEIEKAEAVIINTCGFIDSAKTEAIETIIKVAQLKEEGTLKALIVTGCLSERYKDEIFKELPEVDAICGTGSYEDIEQALESAFKGEKKSFLKDSAKADLDGGRLVMTGGVTAYLKIAEGCDNRCNYCVIPSLRGPYRSRKMENLVNEARELVQGGVRELIVIAQDITRYGTDIYGKRSLHTLVDELCKIEDLKWLRLHYMYPDEIDDILLETIARQEKVLKYFDIPVQHISDKILKAMNRRGDGSLIRERIRKIRAMMPEAVLRTSVIVGFPGETDEDYGELREFFEEYSLERAGVFSYSREEDSVAYNMADQVDEDTKEMRRSLLFKVQTDVMDMQSEGYIGKSLEILCEEYDEDEEMMGGRSYMDSPDIDGIVYISNTYKLGKEQAEKLYKGKFVTAKITDGVGCILFGELEE